MIIDRARVAAALPAYELGGELGAGGFGLVLKGRHRRLDRDVAVKVLAAADDGAPAGFAAEARVLAGMDHPHVVRIYDYVEDDELCLIIMELLAGGTLTRRRGGMPPEGACSVGLAVAEALSCAHDQGVLHRDIKSDNMMFDGHDLLKVTDFGISKIFEGTAVSASAVVGTPKYMAPEQITGGRLGPATDIYALGVVLYELLAGVPPFDPKLPPLALYHHHLSTTPPPPAGIPVPVTNVVMRALAKNPAERHPSTRAFALDLAQAAAHGYGPRWTSRSGIVVRLRDEVREAAERTPAPTAMHQAPMHQAPQPTFHMPMQPPAPPVPSVPSTPGPVRPVPPPPGRTVPPVLSSAPRPVSARPARRFRGLRSLGWTAGGLFLFFVVVCCVYIAVVPQSFQNDPDASVDFGEFWGWAFLLFTISLFGSPFVFAWQVWRLRPTPVSVVPGQPWAWKRPNKIEWNLNINNSPSHTLTVQLPGPHVAVALSGDLRAAVPLPYHVRLWWALHDSADGTVLMQGHIPLVRGRTDPLHRQMFTPRTVQRVTLVLRVETPQSELRQVNSSHMTSPRPIRVTWQWPGVYGPVSGQ